MKSGVLPTLYRGQKFRSRTEARWASFMDALGIRHEYEKEGYQLGDFFYLPDFWLPDLHYFVEVKGEKPTQDECTKAILLAEFTGKEVFIFWGSPRQPWSCSDLPESAMRFTNRGEQDESYWWCECPTCRKIDIAFAGLASRIVCECVFDARDRDPKRRNNTCDTPRIQSAYQAAADQEFWSPRESAQ